jgi:hypothetical protein
MTAPSGRAGRGLRGVWRMCRCPGVLLGHCQDGGQVQDGGSRRGRETLSCTRPGTVGLGVCRGTIRTSRRSSSLPRFCSCPGVGARPVHCFKAARARSTRSAGVSRVSASRPDKCAATYLRLPPRRQTVPGSSEIRTFASDIVCSLPYPYPACARQEPAVAFAPGRCGLREAPLRIRVENIEKKGRLEDRGDLPGDGLGSSRRPWRRCHTPIARSGAAHRALGHILHDARNCVATEAV